MHDWERIKIDKTVNRNCNLEWVGCVINYLGPGFALKVDSGRLCTSLVQDVLNLHLVEMISDGTMELLKKKFQQNTQDIDCKAINAAAGDNEASNPQLSFKEMAGPFLVHSILTGLALILATMLVFTRHFKWKDLEPNGDNHSYTSVWAMKNVNGEDATSEEESSHSSMQVLATGLCRVQKKQDEIAGELSAQSVKQDEIAGELMAQLASITAVLKSMQEKEASQYPNHRSGQFALSDVEFLDEHISDEFAKKLMK
jgi:hypothetical protein